MIVQTVREIIDAVKPVRTFYTLETMPWMYPDSAHSYLELIRAIDRERFAVHLDVVNLVCSPQRLLRQRRLDTRVRGEARPADQEPPCQGHRAG